MRPSELEARLALAAHMLASAPTRAERGAAWTELQRLHRLRTPAAVAAQERRLGLAVEVPCRS
jgi:hypothetical protein